MNERTLEDRLFDAVWQRNEKDVLLAIATALTLARREGCARACSAFGLHLEPESAAEKKFPLPTRTVRKLREEPDPESSGYRFRWNRDRPFDLSNGVGMVESASTGSWLSCGLTPTSARIALWHDLMQRPYHEEEQAVDPNEVLP